VGVVSWHSRQMGVFGLGAGIARGGVCLVEELLLVRALLQVIEGLFI